MKKKVKTFTPLPITGPILAAANAWFQKEDQTGGQQHTVYYPQNPRTKPDFLQLIDSLEAAGYIRKQVQSYRNRKAWQVRIHRLDKFFNELKQQEI